MKITIRILISFSLFCFLEMPCFAEKAYVTDSFRISYRRGPSIENKILKFIESGQPVEVIEKKDGWSRIQVLEQDTSGLEGWVLSRYLISRQPWEKQAKRLMLENNSIEEELISGREKIKVLSAENEQLKNNLNNKNNDFLKLENDFSALKQEASEYLELKAKYEKNKKRLETQLKEIKALKSSKQNKWFALGAVVMLFGLIIGLQIGKQGKKYRTTSFL